jgi:hypothetical protein
MGQVGRQFDEQQGEGARQARVGCQAGVVNGQVVVEEDVGIDGRGELRTRLASSAASIEVIQERWYQRGQPRTTAVKVRLVWKPTAPVS